MPKSIENSKGLKFELYSNYSKSSFNTNDLFQMIFGVATLIFLLLALFDNFLKLGKTFILNFAILVVVLFFISKLASVVSFFSKYEHEKELSGEIHFTLNGIKWCDIEIKWNQIDSIVLSMDEVDFTHRFDFTTSNNISDGINRIEVETIEGQSFRGWYLLPNLRSKLLLEKLLEESIFKNNVSYKIAKSILNPSTYKEHQLLKEKLDNHNFERG